jgi:GH24 family phage-related lysozyme (muramidase)
MLADTERWEGKSYKVYADSKGLPTQGIGHHTGVHFGDADVSDQQITEWLIGDIQTAYFDAFALFKNLDTIDVVRREVLVGLAFNMGGGTLSQFAPFIRAVNAAAWDEAAYHLETNLSNHLTPYLIDTGVRGAECAIRIDSGEILPEYLVTV